MEIDLKKWVLSYDKGHRYDLMTTSLSKGMNGVLKQVRFLLLKVLIESFL
jgi:hypothetical protein